MKVRTFGFRLKFVSLKSAEEPRTCELCSLSLYLSLLNKDKELLGGGRKICDPLVAHFCYHYMAETVVVVLAFGPDSRSGTGSSLRHLIFLDYRSEWIGCSLADSQCGCQVGCRSIEGAPF